jgi:3-hydroxyacyl-[acyl-carrier-protein] dehydratase
MPTTLLIVAADHPAFSGHFPGRPVLPGVVLLDLALQAVAPGPEACWQISSAKFHSAVRPGESLWLDHEWHGEGRVQFALRTQDRAIAEGSARLMGRPAG